MCIFFLSSSLGFILTSSFKFNLQINALYQLKKTPVFNGYYTCYQGSQGDCSVLHPTLMCAVPLILDRIFKGIQENVNKKGNVGLSLELSESKLLFWFLVRMSCDAFVWGSRALFFVRHNDSQSNLNTKHLKARVEGSPPLNILHFSSFSRFQ